MAQLKPNLLTQQSPRWRNWWEFTLIKDLSTQGISVSREHFNSHRQGPVPATQLQEHTTDYYWVKYGTPWPHWHVILAVTIHKLNGWITSYFLIKKWYCGFGVFLSFFFSSSYREVAESIKTLWCSPVILTYTLKNELAEFSPSPHHYIEQSPQLGCQETADIIPWTPPLMKTLVVNNSRFLSCLSSLTPEITGITWFGITSERSALQNNHLDHSPVLVYLLISY